MFVACLKQTGNQGLLPVKSALWFWTIAVLSTEIMTGKEIQWNEK